jgi:hypothetical protein
MSNKKRVGSQAPTVSKAPLPGFIAVLSGLQVRGLRWICLVEQEREIEWRVAMIDLALRAFGPWRSGDFFRVASGDFHVATKWIGQGEQPSFDDDGFHRFLGCVGSHAVNRVLEANGHPVPRKRLDAVQKALEGSDMKKVESLIDELARKRKPLVLGVGPTGKRVRLVAGELPVRNQPVPPLSFPVSKRSDGAVVVTECGLRVMVRNVGAAGLNAGDRIRFDRLVQEGTVRVLRARRARVRTEQNAQGELLPR